jgi:hypothetical protein
MRLCGVAAVLLVAAGGPSRATTLISMDLPELVSTAHTIAYGRVTDTRATVVSGRTETVVTVNASAYLKGDGGHVLTFRVPGGQIGRYRTVVVGAPVLCDGDEVVVFLNGTGPQLPTVVGFSQGVLHVHRDSGGADPVVLAPPSPRGDRAERVVRGIGARRLMPLSTFVEEVHALDEGVKAARERRGSGAVTRGGK